MTKDQPNSLRFLLYLEWILLLIVALVELPSQALLQIPRSPWLNWIGLSIFAVLGLMPSRQWLSKLLYFSLELALILLMTMQGGLRLFHLLYIVLVIRNCSRFRGWQNGVLTGVVVLLCALSQFHRLQQRPLLARAIAEQTGLIWFSFLLLFGLVVLFLQLLVNALLAERRSRDQLTVANSRLRDYALKIEDLATLQERNRIAREIHDALGHSLTAFNLHLAAALRLLRTDPTEAELLLQEAKQLGATALADVRQSVATLRSDPLQGKTLEQAIASLVNDFQRSTGISPVCDIRLQHPISKDLGNTLYRIAQESLTNICKYANATKVEITLQTTADNVQLIITDNGQGFDPAQNLTGFGLQGMQERTLALAGRFEIVTAPGAGCRIIANFPSHS
jgi:signal transduction histidine kinase